MFKNFSIAEFNVDGFKAQFIIDAAMPIAGVQAVLNKLMHFCVERMIEAENEAAQKVKDEEASKVRELEAEKAPKVEAEKRLEETAKI